MTFIIRKKIVSVSVISGKISSNCIMEIFRIHSKLKFLKFNSKNYPKFKMSFHGMPTDPKVSKKMKEEQNKIKTTDLLSKVFKTRDWSRNESSKIKIPFEDMPTPPKFPKIKETPDLIGAKKKTPSRF